MTITPLCAPGRRQPSPRHEPNGDGLTILSAWQVPRHVAPSIVSIPSLEFLHRISKSCGSKMSIVVPRRRTTTYNRLLKRGCRPAA